MIDAICYRIEHNFHCPEDQLPLKSQCVDCQLNDAKKEIQRLRADLRKERAQSDSFLRVNGRIGKGFRKAEARIAELESENMHLWAVVEEIRPMFPSAGFLPNDAFWRRYEIVKQALAKLKALKEGDDA